MVQGGAGLACFGRNKTPVYTLGSLVRSSATSDGGIHFSTCSHETGYRAVGQVRRILQTLGPAAKADVAGKQGSCTSVICCVWCFAVQMAGEYCSGT